VSTSFEITKSVRVHNNQLSVDHEVILSFDDVQKKEAGVDFVTACFKQLNIAYPRFYKMDLMCKWGLVCAEWLLQHEKISETDPYKKAIVLQNSSSSLLTDRNFQQSIEKVASPALFVYTLPNIVMGEIAIRQQFKGENTFFVTEHSDEKQLQNYTGFLFDHQIATVVISGYLEVNADYQDITFYLNMAK